MKKTYLLPKLLQLAIFLGAVLFMGIARASHNPQLGNITYVNVAPNVYLVTYKAYFGCAGTNPGTTNGIITYRAPGCNDSLRSLSFQFPNIPTQLINPYCNSSTISPCSGNPAIQPGLDEFVYNTTITLPSPCSNWIVNASFETRPYTRNLANKRTPGAWEKIFTEALINNQVTQTNTSPDFSNYPILFAAVDNVHAYNHGTFEPDGDSLVYSLVAPLADYNVPVVYSNIQDSVNAPYPAGVSPGGTSYPAGAFSALNPIISRNPLSIDALSGAMVFEPLDFVGANTLNHWGRDRYLVGMQIEEYRKINGISVKIGAVRRDLEVIVYNCGTNSLPRVGAFAINGNNYYSNQILGATAGQQLTITVTSHDDDAVNVVTLTSNVASALPGATFSITGGSRPTGTITWTPSASQVRSAPYYFSVTAADNACPIKGSQTLNLGLRVSGSTSPTGLSKTLPANSFTAYPNPSNSTGVTFKIKPDYSLKNAEVVITNVTGSVVDRIKVKAGEEQIRWNKKTDLPSGVYFARFTSAAGSQTIKLIHLN